MTLLKHEDSTLQRYKKNKTVRFESNGFGNKLIIIICYIVRFIYNIIMTKSIRAQYDNIIVDIRLYHI